MSEPIKLPHEGTHIETDEEVRKALRAQAAAVAGTPQLAPAHPSATPPPALNEPSPSGPEPFRPTVRPPLAILTLMDDGKSDGEKHRLRGAPFVIGRTEGDLRIPFDEMISARHVEIAPRFTATARQWVISDLQSANGLFVRVSRAILSDGTEFLVGKGRYRIAIPPSASAPLQPGGYQGTSTVAWDRAPLGPAAPILFEMAASGPGLQVVLTKSEAWIGTDRSCEIVRADDSFVSPRHLRICRDEKGWHVQNNKSLNGLWLRMTQIVVDEACLFQIGEQRCRLQLGA